MIGENNGINNKGATMRALATSQGKQNRLRKKKKIQQEEREARIQKFKSKKEMVRKLRRTIEWDRVLKDYPDDTYKQVILKNIHPTLRARFLSKCAEEEATMAGKLRYFMWACMNNKIDDVKLNELMAGLTILKVFGPIPKNTSHIFCINYVPLTLHKGFKQWCLIRGYTMSGKLKQLMIAHLKGVVG